jgi:uncharacterized membrane protein
MPIDLELAILATALIASFAVQPWRMLRGGALASPLLGILVILPWLWALPRLHSMPLQLQLSGACAVTLILGWPLSIPVLALVALLGGWIAPADWDTLVSQAVWQGIVPATMAMALGALIRRFAGTHPFVYILGRAFAGTVLCTFGAEILSQLAGHDILHVGLGLSMVARWLVAWGDGFMTGLMAAIFVAFRPQWLATWSDRLYLKPQSPSD